jgi:hypothetical protein
MKKQNRQSPTLKHQRPPGGSRQRLAYSLNLKFYLNALIALASSSFTSNTVYSFVIWSRS